MHAHLRRIHHDERGIALVLVIALSLVLSLFLVAALEFATGNQTAVVRDQRTSSALGTAESAIDDLLFRMNENADYARSVDLGNPAITGWTSPAGGAAEGEYHYSFDLDDSSGQSLVTVTATGRVRGETRTVQSVLSRRGFLDYLSLTDVFTIDPGARSDVPLLQDIYEHYCNRQVNERWYDNRSWELPEYEYVTGNPDPQPNGGTVHFGPMGWLTGRIDRDRAIADLAFRGANRAQATVVEHELYCPKFAYVDGQRIEGPIHSNDGIVIHGTRADEPRFDGAVTTSYANPDDPRWIDLSGRSDPDFQVFGYDFPVEFPPSNRLLEARTDPGEGGCRFQGPTYIELRRSSAFVRSPLTDPTSVPAHCRPAGGGMVGGGPISLTAPDFNGVIYVADAPTCLTGVHPLGMPVPGDVTSYGCTDGDAFVWGELSEQITIGTANDVVAVWDVVYRDTEAVLGLIAENAVWIYHPVDARDRNLLVLSTDVTRPPFGARQPRRQDLLFHTPRIDAAVVTLRRSLSLQNYDRGAPINQAVTVNGAIASPFNGVTAKYRNGTLAHGYAGKRLVYDERLRFLSPPFFIEPTQSSWRQRTFRELPAPAPCGRGQDPAVDGCLPA